MTTRTSDWDPVGIDNITDPIATHRELRQTCPVAYSEQFGGFWSLFKHEDIVAAAGDNESFSAATQFMIPQMDTDMAWLPVQSDPPDHTLYRSIVNPFFKGARLAAYEPHLRDATNERIDSFIHAGQVDLASEFSIPVPAAGLCLLMGLPPDNWTVFRRWHVANLEAGTKGDMAAAAAVFQEMHEFATQLIKSHTASPGDDLISALITADVDGRRLTEKEVRGTFFLLAMGGFETTADVVSRTIVYLSTHPEVCDRLRAEPKLITKAVGEFIRTFAPTQGTVRTARRDVTIRGREIKAGERVLMAWSSGSRDEDVFDDADTCVIDRDSRKLTSFGWGIHKCLGEPLARIEVRAMVEEFLRRIDTFEVDGEPERGFWPTIGYSRLPIRFTKRAG